MGSPPRMRGKLMSAASIPRRIRITPAHAGKTPTAKAVYDAIQDHPRACGENGPGDTIGSGVAGSPPRMRGKQNVPCAVFITRGITPAHAGKTVKQRLRVFARQDHPRACGENSRMR